MEGQQQFDTNSDKDIEMDDNEYEDMIDIESVEDHAKYDIQEDSQIDLNLLKL